MEFYSSSPCAYIMCFWLNDFWLELWPLKQMRFSCVVSSKSTMFSFNIWVTHTFTTLQKSLKHRKLQSSYTSLSSVRLSVLLSQHLSRLLLKNYWCDFVQTLQEWLSIKSGCAYGEPTLKLQFIDFCGPLMIFWLMIFG